MIAGAPLGGSAADFHELITDEIDVTESRHVPVAAQPKRYAKCPVLNSGVMSLIDAAACLHVHSKPDIRRAAKRFGCPEVEMRQRVYPLAF